MKIDELLNRIIKLGCLCQDSGLKEAGGTFLYCTLNISLLWNTLAYFHSKLQMCCIEGLKADASLENAHAGEYPSANYRVSLIPAFPNLDPTDMPTEIIPRWQIHVCISRPFMNAVNFHIAHDILNKFANIKTKWATRCLKIKRLKKSILQ